MTADATLRAEISTPNQVLSKARGWGIIMQFESFKSVTMVERKSSDSRPKSESKISTPMSPCDPKSNSMQSKGLGHHHAI